MSQPHLATATSSSPEVMHQAQCFVERHPEMFLSTMARRPVLVTLAKHSQQRWVEAHMGQITALAARLSELTAAHNEGLKTQAALQLVQLASSEAATIRALRAR